MMFNKYLPVALLSIVLLSFNQPSYSQTPVYNNFLIVSEMNRLFNEGKADSAMQYFSDSLIKAGPPGKSAFKMMQQDIETTFPDVQTKILELLEDGDWVIARCIFSGTHKGIAKLPHHGGLLIGVAPTNKSFSVQHIRMYKVVKGKIVARQAVRDDLGMYQQLGILPASASFSTGNVKPGL
jgi:predicted ester cyclase